MRRLVLIALVLLLGAWTSVAEARGVGTSAMNFLKAGWGARPSGMGGAFVALADDMNAMEWNPAGLSLLPPDAFVATFEHAFWFGDVSYEVLTVGQYLGETYGLGAKLLYRHMPDINNDLDDEPKLRVYDLAGMLGYGFQVANFAIGLNLKFMHSHLGGEDLYGEAADLGMLVYFMERKIALGVSIQNLGPDVNNESLPLNLRGGFAYKDAFGADRLHALNACLEFNQPLDNKLNLQVGVEYWYRSLFAARLGYRQQLGGNDLQSDDFIQHLSAGASVRWADLQLDYGLVPYGALGLTHRLALTLRYGPLNDKVE